MENNIDTVIGINVSVKGNLYNKGSIQVNGFVEGEVKSEENVMIGETAKIKGPVIAKTIEVSGEIRGIVESSERLEINPTGKVFGDINAKTLIIKEGALFVGKSIMPGNSSEATKAKVDGEDEKIEAKTEKIEPTVEKDSNDKVDKLGFFSKK